MNRIAMFFRYIAAMEPARVLAIWRAALVLAGVVVALLGGVLPEGLEAQGAALVMAVYGLIEAITTHATRNKVVPVAKMPPEWLAQIDAVRGEPLPGSAAAGIKHGE